MSLKLEGVRARPLHPLYIVMSEINYRFASTLTIFLIVMYHLILLINNETSGFSGSVVIHQKKRAKTLKMPVCLFCKHTVLQKYGHP